MHQERLRRLLNQYLNNSINPADCIELLDYLNNSPEEFAEILKGQHFDLSEGPEFKGIEANKVFQRIVADKRFNATGTETAAAVIPLFRRQWFRVAAILVVCFTVALSVFKSHRQQVQVVKDQLVKNTGNAVIVPGTNKATLTISGHQVIVLGNLSNGVVAKTGSLNIHKIQDGKLVYKDSRPASNTADDVVTNTLTTPKGGQYQVVLEDGTRVWLNSASSISYPNKFTGDKREVKLTGEAYFEVAKNKDKPFFVNINNVQVRVLGTHFNIAAYNDDDDITTTLLEGSVQMSKNNSMVLLKPGEHGVVKNNSNSIQVATADIGRAMAWKNGYFSFNDESITDIMKKVSRWYDIDVQYRGNIKAQQFGGTYARDKGIAPLLNYLETLGNVHFQIEGRRVVVMN